MAQDENLGPILLSAKHELLANQDYVRLILRLRTGTMHEVVPATCLGEQASPHRMAKVTFSFIVIFFSFFKLGAAGLSEFLKFFSFKRNEKFN